MQTCSLKSEHSKHFYSVLHQACDWSSKWPSKNSYAPAKKVTSLHHGVLTSQEIVTNFYSHCIASQMVYRKLLALPGLKLTHAAIDRDCNLVTRLGYCWNHCKISTSNHNKLATCSLCIWLLVWSTLVTAHNRSKCYETISHVVTAKVGLCVPRRSTRPSSRSTASNRP